MIGQGSPPAVGRKSALVAEHTMCFRLRYFIAVALWSYCALVWGAEEPTLNLRIAWGGGEQSSWEGRIWLDEGKVSNPSSLGLEADEPGSIYEKDGEIHFRQRSSRVYDGVDVSVDASLDATLHIEIVTKPDTPQRVSIPLSELVNGAREVPLGHRQNILLVRRTPGDFLRVKFDRPSLVFSGDETFKFEVVPKMLGLAAGTSTRLDVSLLSLDGESIWSKSHDSRVNEQNELPGPEPFEVDIPKEEGVYELEITLTERRLRLVPARPSFRRKLQLIVISDTPSDDVPHDSEPELVEQFDATASKWWEQWKRIPTLQLLPGFGSGPISGGTSRVWRHGEKKYTQLDRDSWKAYPLPVGDLGKPHILEVQFPNDVPQSLGISILEPNASGALMPIGLDSGVDVEELPVGTAAGIGRHRIIFWPRTRTPLVLLTNRRESGAAAFGKIRILQQPQGLAPANVRGETDYRLLAAYFDKPLFPENFSAQEAADVSTGRSLDDWRTFHQGATRLTEYLHHVGYNGAIVASVCEGSALYPSELLQPTPKYDTGTFFTSGQDGVRKDVLEMLFRVMDREGLQLIPQVQFTSPLPELEATLRQSANDPESVAGIELVSPEGRTWLQQHGSQQGLAPYYNPLDDRVQEAMVRVVAELVERYGHHPSFGGIAVQLTPDGYAQLPGREWGYDRRTRSVFARQTGVRLAEQRDDAYIQLDGLLKARWLAWRESRMQALYEKMRVVIRKKASHAPLYLTAADMMQSEPTKRALIPSSPRRAEAESGTVGQGLLEIGVLPNKLQGSAGLIVPRPYRQAPIDYVSRQGMNLELNRSSEVDQQFADRTSRVPRAASASLFYHEPQKLRLEEFDAASPFGEDNTYTWLVAQISPWGARNRKRFIHSMATIDTQAFMDGGWMLPLGQEESVREVFEVFRKLPPGTYETFSSDTVQPVVVRRMVFERQQYVYLVNDSPWPVTATLKISSTGACRVTRLRRSAKTPRLARTQNELTWTVKLKPYDLAGARVSDSTARIRVGSISTPKELATVLKTRQMQYSARAASLASAPPMSGFVNAGFENVGRALKTPGWDFADDPGVSIRPMEANSHGGQKALLMESKGPNAWVRSDVIPTPTTGRISIEVHLRVDDPNVQPPLRLAIEGVQDGTPYYRFANVGKWAGAQGIKDTWVPYVFPLEDLPVEGLKDLRVGFDMMGAGRVWIDDVKVYTLPFSDAEQNELGKFSYFAANRIKDGKLADAHRLLTGYWARYLLEHVPAPSPRVAKARPAAIAPPKPKAPVEPPETSMWQRMKGMFR